MNGTHDALGAFQFRSRKSMSNMLWLILVAPLLWLIGIDLWQEGAHSTVIVLASVLLLGGGYWLVDRLVSYIDVYHNGLVCRRLWGGVQTMMFDADMRVFVHRWQYGWWLLTFAKHIKLKIVWADKSSYHIAHSFQYSERMVAVIEHYQFIHAWAITSQDYDVGKTLDFVALQLNHAAIQIGKKSIAQADLGDVVLSDGSLRFHLRNQKGKSKYFAAAKVPLYKIANLSILCHLLGFKKQDVAQYGYGVRRLPFL